MVCKTGVDNANPPILAIGLMSGTSADGIDAALVQTNGVTLKRVAATSAEYRNATRCAIMRAYDNPSQFLKDELATRDLSVCIAQDHAVAVQQLLAKTNEPVSLLGFHGQTIVHKPERGVSVQLGDAAVLARLTQTDTVYDFRSLDLQAGGHGAPLAPIYHQNILESIEASLPAIVLNIGGVANLTYWDGAGLVGFDTGPGNGLLDQYMQKNLGKAFDSSGELSASGQADERIVRRFLAQSYFKKAYPKSLDRADFNQVLTELGSLAHHDAMATLLALSVGSIKLAVAQLDMAPAQIIVCGGGQHNKTMIGELQRALYCTVQTADSLGLSGDFMEAELMGFLAARFQYKMPATFPHTTGALKPCVAGRLQSANCL